MKLNYWMIVCIFMGSVMNVCCWASSIHTSKPFNNQWSQIGITYKLSNQNLNVSVNTQTMFQSLPTLPKRRLDR